MTPGTRVQAPGWTITVKGDKVMHCYNVLMLNYEIHCPGQGYLFWGGGIIMAGHILNMYFYLR